MPPPPQPPTARAHATAGALAARLVQRRSLAGGPLLAALLALGVGASSACGTRAATERAPASPVGVEWRLERILMMDDTELRPGDPSRYTLLLGEDGNASLRADCNRARGRYRLEGARLELGPLATTRAMCPPGSLFDRYTKLLGIAVSWQLTGDGQLAIATSVDSGILFFRRAP